jgi:hypothetical protein
MARIRAAVVAFACACPTGALAKDTQFWNLTPDTITSLQLSAAGKNDWGPNQAENDSDKSVSPDERLKILGIKSGIYDVKFVDQAGHSCIVRDVAVKEGKVFSIDQKTPRACEK